MLRFLKSALALSLELAPAPIRRLWSNSAFNVWKIASVTAVATTIGIAIADRLEPPPPPVPEKAYRKDSWKRDYPRPLEPAPGKEQAQPAPPPQPAPQNAELKPAEPQSLPAPAPIQAAPAPPAIQPVFKTHPAPAARKPKQSEMGNYNYIGQ
jgi:hypothetical protein